MENTIENKAKFFAMYWGLEFTGSDHYGEYMPDTWSEFPKYVDKQYLILKPLSSISDEDATRVAMIENDYTDPVLRGKSLVDTIQRDYVRFKPSVVMDISDFLRSRGHALPWMGLSVEKLIEYGWIKLKED